MSFSSWLQNGKRPAPAPRRRTQTSPRQRANFRPHLESLEDRCLLSSAIVQTNLVSDVQGLAQVQDTNLVNPWGLAASPNGAWWVANEGTGTSTLYNTSTSPSTVESLVVKIPANPNGSSYSFIPANSPTGIVYNTGGTGTFDLTPGNNATSSQFLFDTLDGTISGWSSGGNATVMVNNPSAIYTGLAMATDSKGATLLYAANFGQGTIEVYNQNFQPVTLSSHAFTDSQLPAGYAPFNIQAIDNKLYVEYAPVTPILDGLASPGTGAVDVYSSNGVLLQRLIPPGQAQLNEPWAVAMAPANFGSFSNDLLVGNFGDGQINAFNPNSGQFVGVLEDASGQPISIPHLWGLEFGNGGAAGPTNTLYFTAGLTSHLAPGTAPFHGQFGSLTVAEGHAPPTPLTPPTPPPTPPMSSPYGMLAQQIDAIFQKFDADLLSLESNFTAMDPQLSGLYATLNSNLDALEATFLDRLDALETAGLSMI
ncbi:MAG TPA: TIGR03118 family protein [Gemmataceae bacterium]|nr:TIGR03118 family protein [Gemmataceae bacterium]